MLKVNYNKKKIKKNYKYKNQNKIIVNMKNK